MEIVHPEYLLTNEKKNSLLQDKLTPVYPITEGVPQKSLRKIIDQAILKLSKESYSFNDLIPRQLIKPLKLPSLKNAIFELHNPSPTTDKSIFLNAKHPAQKRLILEELLAHHLSMRQLRSEVQSNSAPAFSSSSNLLDTFKAQLPFQLTNAQSRVIKEIQDNVCCSTPMLRLVQGDVGSGKTVVAMAAALQAVEADYQVAFMAPTEMLAEQHFENISNWTEKLDINTGWLSGKVKASQRKSTLEQLLIGEIQILVGTHALFQSEVKYQKLGLIIIDEQHRFGVHQRLALKEKGFGGGTPHQLIMTATPIPRTLAMTAYADLDLSVIDELPKGRQGIDTVVIPEQRREQIIQRVNEACNSGRQAYWVCPVIEVGVDVPNASLMIIDNAERLGLSQLHQLRGRVGRGSIKSSCVLLYQGKLSKVGKERLSIMRETNDGFAIAEKDLEIRGPGELLGTKQTGLLQLRIADITRDQYLFPIVEDLANKITTHYPENIQPLINRWLNHGLQYGNV